MKVHITGMGAMSSLGLGVGEFFEGLKAGRTGITARPEWKQYVGLHSHLGASVPAYDITQIPRSARRTMSRMSELAVVATLEAVRGADLLPGHGIGGGKSTPRIAICLGSTSGSPDTLETYFRKLIERGGPEGQMGTTFFKVMNHSVAANVAAALGFVGPVIAPSSACSTSAQAIIHGWELLQTGLYDIVIAGGADELHYTSAAVFDVVLAASRGFNDRPDEASRPFDSRRDGLVVSEGAGVVVLETEASARARGVRSHAELAGGAVICDANHMSQPNGEAMDTVMRLSLERARLQAEDIGYFNAHATATVQGDREEAQAVRRIFGDRVPVSSLKGHLGHSLAACGALEAIACVKMLEESVLIPTRNLQEIDPECAGIQHLQALEKRSFRHAISTNFAFGGMNTSLVVSGIN